MTNVGRSTAIPLPSQYRRGTTVLVSQSEWTSFEYDRVGARSTGEDALLGFMNDSQTFSEGERGTEAPANSDARSLHPLHEVSLCGPPVASPAPALVVAAQSEVHPGVAEPSPGTQLDRARLRELCDELDADSVKDLVEEFLSDLPRRQCDLQALRAGGSRLELRRAAHSLKGASASLGLDALAALCSRLEHAVDAGQNSQLVDLMEPLPGVIDEAVRALNLWVADQSRANT